MRAATFPWFVNGLQNANEQAVFLLPATTIKGYQLSISAGALDWSLWQGSTYAVFDFQALVSNTQGWPTNVNEVGVLVRVGGPAAVDPPIGYHVNDGMLAAAYAIVEQPGEHSNQSIVVPYGGIEVPVPPNSYLLFNVAHSGGKGTFAVKLTVYFD